MAKTDFVLNSASLAENSSKYSLSPNISSIEVFSAINCSIEP